MIRATSRPAARDAHPVGSSGSELPSVSAARGSVIDDMSLARPGSEASAYGTYVLLYGGRFRLLGSSVAAARQGRSRPA